MTTTTQDIRTEPVGPSAVQPKRTNGLGVVISGIFGLIGIGLLLGGGALIALHGSERDDDGYYTSGAELVESPGYAIATDEIDLGAEPVGVPPDDIASSLRLRAENEGGTPVFIGVARTADADAYLGGAERSVVTDFGGDGIELDARAGGRPDGKPADQDIWVAQAQGTGEQTLEWGPQNGSWTAVVMNASADRGVATELDAGVEIPWLIWVGIGLAGFGLAVTAASGLGLVRSLR